MANIQVREEYAKLVYDGETLVGMFKRDNGGLKLFKIGAVDYSRVHEIFGASLPLSPDKPTHPDILPNGPGRIVAVPAGTHKPVNIDKLL